MQGSSIAEGKTQISGSDETSESYVLSYDRISHQCEFYLSKIRMYSGVRADHDFPSE